MSYPAVRNCRTTVSTEYSRVILCCSALRYETTAIVVLLSAFGVSSAAGPESPADRSRLFPTVLKMDTVSNTWRAQNAWARIRIANGMLTVTVWNRWGEERINPLFRITVGNTPERNEAEGTWSYEGTIRRTADGFEKTAR